MFWTNTPLLSGDAAGARALSRVAFDVWLDERVDYFEECTAALARGVNLGIQGTWQTFAYADAVPTAQMAKIFAHSMAKNQAAVHEAHNAAGLANASLAASRSRAEELRRWLAGEEGAADAAAGGESGGGGGGGRPPAPALPARDAYSSAAALVAAMADGGCEGAERMWQQAAALAAGAGRAEYVDDRACITCRKSAGSAAGELLVCARCNYAIYCSADCQRVDWQAGHKTACRAPTAGRDAENDEV